MFAIGARRQERHVMMALWGKWLRSIVWMIILFHFVSAHDSIAAKVDISKGPVTIEADSIAYDKEKDTYHAQGNVLIVFSGGFLMAESVVLNRITNDAFAEGYVMVVSDNDTLEGDKVIFNTETKTGVAYDGQMFLARNHFYVTGSKIQKTGEETYHIDDATVTTCDGNFPDWRLMGSELDVTIDGYGTMKHSRFLTKNLPVFYTPYFLFPAKTTRQSGFLIPRLSYSSHKLGWDVELPYYWAISKSTDATLYQRYMDKRGFKEGVEFRYFISNSSFGTFYGDYMKDAWRVKETAEIGGTPETGVAASAMSRNWQSDHKRWSYYLNHETTFTRSFSLRTDIRKVSDTWYFKDFSSHNYYLENYSKKETQRFKKVSFVGDESLGSLDSTVRLVKNWQLYNLTALASYTDDFASASNDATLQKYPEITLKGIKRPMFGTPLYFEFDTTYDYLYRNKGQKGAVYDIQPVLSMPLAMRDYLRLKPQIGVKSTFWDRNDHLGITNTRYDKQGDREIYTAGATATTEVHRIFNVDSEGIEKIRHGIKPELIYTYIPNVYQEDTPDFVTRIPEQNTLTYALTNTLVAKMKEKGGAKSYREFLRFKLFQTYDFKEANRGDLDLGAPRDKRPFSDVGMELDVKPFQYLSFQARNKYSVNSGEWKQTNYDMNISDWRGDSATLGYRYAKYAYEDVIPSGSTTPFSPYRYTQYSLEETNLALKAVLTKFLSLSYIYRRNDLDKRTLEKTYGINYTKQCWSIELKYSVTQDGMGNNDYGTMMTFSLYGLGKVGR